MYSFIQSYGSRYFVRSIVLLVGVLFLLTSPTTLFAQTGGATLGFAPANGSYATGKTFTVQVTINSSQDFNSGNAKITFDKTLLSVDSISKNNSAFSLWAVEPSSSNSDGTINFEGGNTTALNGTKNILLITFKALAEGSAKVTVDSGSVLAADGKGTDILGTKGAATYTITAKTADPPLTQTADTSNNSPDPNAGPLPEAPTINSSTHPDETAWYNLVKASFSWDIPPDVTAVRLAFDDKASTTPTTTYDPAIAEKDFDQLADGVMYVHLKYKNDTGWGPTAHKKVRVDRTPPGKFTAEVSTIGSTTDVMIKGLTATDSLSGIDRYDLIIDGGSPAKVTPIDITDGAYTLTSQSPGDHQINIHAVDKAGNFSESNGKFVIIDTTPKPGADNGQPKGTDWELVMIIILIAITAFLAGYMWYERNSFRHEKYVIKREADELRDHLSSVFGALQEEISEQAGRIFQKPNPSALDREIMEAINESMDLSEELLAKDVEDVRKLLM